MDLQLTGKNAIVTGASRGIGRAIARQLALEGCDVAICARNEERLKQAAAELNRAALDRSKAALTNAQSNRKVAEVQLEVSRIKQQPGGRILTGGVQLPLALAELDLIDEYEFIMQPRIAGHGPTLLSGLSRYVELKLVDRKELSSGAIALRYEPRR